ncbi:protein CROWDED NUCLEI 1-like isoform X1 [Cotesia glomerata]|uniref:protein CROWDED NUCLEI 1-like isoform X1 n=1 Tax=Cotesia glomerata TaxID=32391 RepID=UPI001D0033AB|nr:protein CROWDED NUCLEI 1-like isoform X1 [Cotesia glomerata]
MTMNKFFKSKSKKELKIESKKSLEVEKNKRQKTEMMGSAIEKLASNFHGVVNKDINNDNTGVDGKNHGSLQPSTPGTIERPKKIHKEKNQVDNRETFKRVEIKETLITKQSKFLIKKGPDDKIVVARQTQTTEQSTKFTKNYLNGDPLDVEVSSTTQDDQLTLINVSNNLDKVSNDSNDNLSLNNDLKTYKNAQKVIGLNDTSESDSTILLMPCNLKKKKKNRNSKNSLSKNKKLALNNKKVNSLENKESEIIKSVDPLSDSDQKNNSELSKENLLDKKMDCKIQGKDVADSDSTLSSTPIESQNITRIDSVNDSDSTVFLTPVEQNKSVVNETHEVDSDSTIFLTPSNKPKNRKKIMKASDESSEEPPKKKSKNIHTCEKVNQLNESIYKVPAKFSSKELKEKFIKIVREEKLKKKIVAIFKHEGPAQTETKTLPASSQELKDKLDKILGDEGLVDNNKEPKIDELREKLSEMFGNDILKSQIEPPPALSNEEVLNILKPKQYVNTAVDTSLSERVDLVVNKKENLRVYKSKAEKKKSLKINGEKLFKKIIQESNVKNSKVGEEKEEMGGEELEDTSKLLDESLSLNKKENLFINKPKTEKKKNSKINGEKSSKKQDESNVKKSKIGEENEEMEDELEDTLKLDESLSLNKKENAFINKPKAAEKKNSKINKEKSSRKRDESNVKKSKVGEEKEEMEHEELEDTSKLLDESLSLNKKENLFINKSKSAEKKKSLKINGEKSSRKIIQDESNAKNSKVVEEKEEMEREELEDTLKFLNESNDSQSRVLEETLKLPEIPELVSYKMVEVGDLNHQSYNEESDDGTDSSFGKLVIDESPNETTELLDTSNLNEIDFEKDSIDNEKDPLYVDNSDHPLAICVLEDENHSDVAHSEQQHVNSLKENNESDSRGRLTETLVDISDISVKNFDKTRELLVVVERVDVDKFKRKKSVQVTDSLKTRSSLKEKISLANSQADLFDLCLKRELKVELERLPLKINQNTLKNKNKINLTEPKNKIVRKFNNSRKRTNKIIKHKTVRQNQILLKEVRIILTPIKLNNDQNLKNKQTINETLNSSAVDKKLTKKTRESQNKNKAMIPVSKSTRKRLENLNSTKEIKKISRVKSSSKVVKNASNNLTRNRKLKSNLKAIKTKSNSSNLSQHQNLKVTLERISTADLVKWRKKNSTRSKVTQRSKVSSQ